MRPLRMGVLVALPLVTVSSASAALIFDDRDAYDAAVGAPTGTESFEGIDEGALDLPESFLSGVDLDLLEAPGWIAEITTNQVFSSTTDGSQHLRVGFGSDGAVVSFGLPSLMAAFGMDLSGFQDLDGDGLLGVMLYADGALVEAVSIDAPSPSASFVGWTSDVAFDEVRVVVEGSDIVGFDALTFSVVPGPGAVAAFGFAALLGGRRRRR